MSRSYKKVGAYAWAGGSDKWNRSRYHRDERRKVKAICHEVEMAWEPDIPYDPNEIDIPSSDSLYCEVYHFGLCDIPYKDWMDEEYNPDCTVYEQPLVGSWESIADDIVMNAVDYSLHSADKYSWASDGGAYWRDDKSSIRTVFDRDIFGAPQHSWRWNYKESTVWERYIAERNARHNKKHPQLSVHIEYRKLTFSDPIWGDSFSSFRRVAVVPYNREHKYPNSVFDGIDGEVTRVSVYKRRGPKQLQNPKWDVIDYVISIAPTTFHGPKDLIEWLRAHQEDIIDGMFKRRFGK